MRRRTALLIAVLAAVVGALVATPVAVFAAHQFTDVPNTNPFHDDIDWLADAEVTLGCGPNVYCPKDNVTREQMAAFMRRLAERTTPRVSFDTRELDFGHGEDPVTVSTEITAPAPGILVMSAGVDLFNGTQEDVVRCSLHVDGERVPGSDMAIRNDGGASVNVSENCITMGTLEVEAGSFDVDFVMSRGLVSAGTHLLEATVWVMWVPFDGEGHTP